MSAFYFGLAVSVSVVVSVFAFVSWGCCLSSFSRACHSQRAARTLRQATKEREGEGEGQGKGKKDPREPKTTVLTAVLILTLQEGTACTSTLVFGFKIFKI